MSERVTIIGAGFTGLTTAYYCMKRGLKVDLYESSSEVGGLIHTIDDGIAKSETAANGLIDSDLLRDLCTDLDVELLVPQKIAKKRFIFRNGKAHQWPLGFVSSLRVGFFILRFFLKFKSLRPRASESLNQWGRRCLGAEATEFLLEPAMRGIYAGDVDRLSASLLLQRVFNPIKKARKKSRFQTVCPKEGMQELTLALKKKLRDGGVRLFVGKDCPPSLKLPKSNLVLACGPESAADLTSSLNPKVSEALRKIELTDVISVTINFEPSPRDLRGFGCLFPRNEEFHALGVLFNSDIFENRSRYRSEKWILGGAVMGEKMMALADVELIDCILTDRVRLIGERGQPLSFQIHRWPRSLPHYTTDFETLLPQLQGLQNFNLAGNYLGRIGLSDLLTQSQLLAQSLGENYHG